MFTLEYSFSVMFLSRLYLIICNGSRWGQTHPFPRRWEVKMSKCQPTLRHISLKATERPVSRPGGSKPRWKNNYGNQGASTKKPRRPSRLMGSGLSPNESLWLLEAADFTVILLWFPFVHGSQPFGRNKIGRQRLRADLETNTTVCWQNLGQGKGQRGTDKKISSIWPWFSGSRGILITWASDSSPTQPSLEGK